MKTEPTEALRLIEYSWYALPNATAIDRKDCIEAVNIAFKEGQSNPKIKKLEWVEVNGLGEIGIEAKTPFGNYEVYEKSDHDGYILWWFDPKPYVFDTEIEAKMYAQADFERRVMECLD